MILGVKSSRVVGGGMKKWSVDMKKWHVEGITFSDYAENNLLCNADKKKKEAGLKYSNKTVQSP